MSKGLGHRQDWNARPRSVLKGGERKQVLEERCGAGSPVRQALDPISMTALGWKVQERAPRSVELGKLGS